MENAFLEIAAVKGTFLPFDIQALRHLLENVKAHLERTSSMAQGEALMKGRYYVRPEDAKAALAKINYNPRKLRKIRKT